MCGCDFGSALSANLIKLETTAAAGGVSHWETNCGWIRWQCCLRNWGGWIRLRNWGAWWIRWQCCASWVWSRLLSIPLSPHNAIHCLLQHWIDLLLVHTAFSSQTQLKTKNFGPLGHYVHIVQPGWEMMSLPVDWTGWIQRLEHQICCRSFGMTALTNRLCLSKRVRKSSEGA